VSEELTGPIGGASTTSITGVTQGWVDSQVFPTSVLVDHAGLPGVSSTGVEGNDGEKAAAVQGEALRIFTVA
jgi:hypothetical protein